MLVRTGGAALAIVAMSGCLGADSTEGPLGVDSSAGTAQKFCSCQADLRAPASTQAPQTLVRAKDLAPAWGYYQASNDDPPTAKRSGAILTWVAHFPQAPQHHVFAKLAGPLDNIQGAPVRVDDVPLPIASSPTPVPDHPGWYALGAIPGVSEGPHHIDLALGGEVAVAEILLSTTDSLPSSLPAPQAQPVARYPRAYRWVGATGPWVVGPANRFDGDPTDWWPAADLRLTMFAARNQTVAGAFSLAKLATTPPFESDSVTLYPSDLRLDADPSVSIPSTRVDVRIGVSTVDPAWLWVDEPARPTLRALVKEDDVCPGKLIQPPGSKSPLLFCPTDGMPAPTGNQGAAAIGLPARTMVAAGEERQIWVTVDLSEESAAPGQYSGEVTLEGKGGTALSIPINLVVADVTLPAAPGWNGVFYGRCPTHVGLGTACTQLIETASAVGEYVDQRRHGMTAAMSHAGYAAVNEVLAASFPKRQLLAALADDGTVGENTALSTLLAQGFDVVQFLRDEPPPPCCGAAGSACSSATCSAVCCFVPDDTLCSASVTSNCCEPLLDRAAWWASIPDSSAPPGKIRREAVLESLSQSITTRQGFSPPRKVALSVNHPSTLRWFAPADVPIVAISIAGAGEAFETPPSNPPGRKCEPHAPITQPLAYWQSSVSYPIYHRVLAGRFTRNLGFDGVMVNAYDQQWPTAFTIPDQNGSPIPTAAWEATREGIDDLRYAAALDEALDELKLFAESPYASPALALVHDELSTRAQTLRMRELADGDALASGLVTPYERNQFVIQKEPYHLHLLRLDAHEWTAWADSLRVEYAALTEEVRSYLPAP